MCLDEQCEFMEETCLNTMPYCIILFAIGLPPPPKKNPNKNQQKQKQKLLVSSKAVPETIRQRNFLGNAGVKSAPVWDYFLWWKYTKHILGSLVFILWGN